MLSVLAEVGKSFKMYEKLKQASQNYDKQSKDISIFHPLKKLQLAATSSRADHIANIIASKIGNNPIAAKEFKKIADEQKMVQHPIQAFKRIKQKVEETNKHNKFMSTNNNTNVGAMNQRVANNMGG